MTEQAGDGGNDLVQRLRTHAGLAAFVSSREYCLEAADKIEQLEQAIRSVGGARDLNLASARAAESRAAQLEDNYAKALDALVRCAGIMRNMLKEIAPDDR